MQNNIPDLQQLEHSRPTAVRSEDVRLEFRENKATVTEQIMHIRSTLTQHDTRMTEIQKELRATEHIKTNQNQLVVHDARMTRIENEVKSLIKWWVAVTGTISGAIIGAAKLFLG